MTKSECRMTEGCPQVLKAFIRHWSMHSTFIRHSDFVIRHFQHSRLRDAVPSLTHGDSACARSRSALRRSIHLPIQRFLRK